MQAIADAAAAAVRQAGRHAYQLTHCRACTLPCVPVDAGFAPELYGGPLSEDDVLDQKVVTKGPGGLPYYLYELKQHRLVAACATGARC